MAAKKETGSRLPVLKDTLETAVRVLASDAPLFAGTTGLNGMPQVRPADFLFAQNNALYFLTMKSSRMYAELCKTPQLQLCAEEPDLRRVFRISGKACFTEEREILDRCVTERKELFQRFGGDRKMLIAFFLTDAELIVSARDGMTDEVRLRLPDPDGVLVGITVKKKTELRDRLSKILEQRESEPPAEADELQKLYDGALFVFAEAAKAVWPRMDIQPIERAAVFETWDEREKYTALAAALIGNAVIDKPEDLTYWLNRETLSELLSRSSEQE